MRTLPGGQRVGRVLSVAIGATLLALALAQGSPAMADDERPTTATVGHGAVPAYRTDGPTLLVCPAAKADFDNRVSAFPDELKATNEALWTQCAAGGYRNLQDAINKAKDPGTTIKILPGIYQEPPSLAPATPECGDVPPAGSTVLTFDQQATCPNNQNLVAILGKSNLQIEGTGAKPDDVIIDAQFKRANGIRADRSPGIYLRNFVVQRTTSSAIYLLESDGFAVDRVTGRWNGENGFLSRAGDHGLFTGCSAYGNGAAGISVEASANVNAHQQRAVDRYAVEIKECRAEENLRGFSGSGGNSVWVHDNVFANNTVGVSTDSTAANLPGLPQNHALFEKNVINSNNEDYYRFVRDGTCKKPYAQQGIEDGVVCPLAGVPVGTGVLNTGGNYNSWRGNWVFDNRYAGVVSTWVPAFVRADGGLTHQVDTSHHDVYNGNILGTTPNGAAAPNGMDLWWDGQGVGSCWQRPSNGAEPMAPPGCRADEAPVLLGTHRYLAEPGKVLKLLVCSDYDLASQRIPTDCDWFGARGFDRIEVKYALGGAILLGLIMLIMWWRLLGGSRLAFLGLALSLGGLVVGIYGTRNETTPLTAIGLALGGFGWLAVGIALRRRGRPGLGWLTLGVAVFALLGAIDRSVFMLPFIPVPPSVIRIALEAYWVPCAVVAAIRGRMLATTPSLGRPRTRRSGGERPRNTRGGPADPLERFAATLRR